MPESSVPGRTQAAVKSAAARAARRAELASYTLDQWAHASTQVFTETKVITLKGHHSEWAPNNLPDGVVYLGNRVVPRGRTNRWDLPEHPLRNPFSVKEHGRGKAIKLYREHVLARPDLMELIPALRGLTLACWCSPASCHASVIAALADAGPAPRNDFGHGDCDPQWARPEPRHVITVRLRPETAVLL
jgi:hypothetical protein